MLWFFLAGVVALAFVLGAIRILVGWFAPAHVGVSFDRGLDVVGRFSAKLFVVIVGLFIISIVVLGLVHG